MNKRVACTSVHNEKVMLPIWLSYFSRYFDELWVLTHNVKDEWMADIRSKYKFKEREINYGEVFTQNNQDYYVSQFYDDMSKTHDYILYTDVDELVVADPEKYPGGLGEFIDKADKHHYYCNGYEIYHNKGEEPALDLTKPLLRQRKYWAYSRSYCKPLLAKERLPWILGFHQLNKDNTWDLVEKQITKDLYLLHLNRMDWYLAKDRWHYSGMDKATLTDFDYHFRIVNGEEFKLEPLPERFKDII